LSSQDLPLPSASPAGKSVAGPEAHAGVARARDPKDLLARLWAQNTPLLRERLARLDVAAAEAQLGPLSEARRAEASDISHKFAGSLGMFGYPRGTEIARELEAMLEGEDLISAGEIQRLARELRSVLPL